MQHICTLHAKLQVDLFIDEVDQVDITGNAYVTGAASQPQQPQLQQMRRTLDAAKQRVLLAESSNVGAGGGMPRGLGVCAEGVNGLHTSLGGHLIRVMEYA
jgi:hypothetical protein